MYRLVYYCCWSETFILTKWEFRHLETLLGALWYTVGFISHHSDTRSIQIVVIRRCECKSKVLSHVAQYVVKSCECTKRIAFSQIVKTQPIKSIWCPRAYWCRCSLAMLSYTSGTKASTVFILIILVNHRLEVLVDDLVNIQWTVKKLVINCR